MDPRALELLELPAILDRLAAEAASEPGKDRSLALVPSGDPDEVDRRQSLTRGVPPRDEIDEGQADEGGEEYDFGVHVLRSLTAEQGRSQEPR